MKRNYRKSMIKESTLHFVLALIAFLLSVILLLLPRNILPYVEMFCPVLFFAILTGMLTSPVYGAFVGALAPLAAFALRGTPVFLPDVLANMISCAAAGVMAGICYQLFMFPFGAAVAALLLSRIVLGVTKVILCLILKMSYKFTDYLDEAMVSVWPGILACIVLIPLLLAALKKRGAMKALHRNLDFNR